MITHIMIRNFRSIASQEIEANWITTLVGNNDAGKSNVLRALNLFFNGLTDPKTPFDFENDYCTFGRLGKNKAREIEVRIRFMLPDSYLREDLPSEIEWSKRWRKDGLVASERSYLGGVGFVSRSKVPALLDRITFRHIPAVKDQQFFTDLQGSLYDVLASVAARPLRNSASEFEKQLQDQLSDLLNSLQASFGADATMKLPENLRQIFEALEINSNGIPLSRRGDGIKIRHIPMILAFIASKQDQILNRGGVKYTHVWGFEEPENSVEMSACFQMAKDLTDIIEENDNYQLFITTHSPVFYKLPDAGEPDEKWVQTLFVEKTPSGTLVSAKHSDEVDETMGLMPLVAPFVEAARDKLSKSHEDLKVARELAELRRPTAFLEGGTDARVLRKAFSIFSPEVLNKSHLHEGGTSYGGANAVASRAIAWLLEMRHRAPEHRTRALAVFDDDLAGREAKENLTADIQRLKLKHSPHFEYFILPPTAETIELRKKGLAAPSDLESYYSQALWQLAQKRGWLEEVADMSTRLSPKTVKCIVNGGLNPVKELDADQALRFIFTFSADGKEKMSKYIAAMDDDEARKQLSLFNPLIQRIVAGLGFAN